MTNLFVGVGRNIGKGYEGIVIDRQDPHIEKIAQYYHFFHVGSVQLIIEKFCQYGYIVLEPTVRMRTAHALRVSQVNVADENSFGPLSHDFSPLRFHSCPIVHLTFEVLHCDAILLHIAEKNDDTLHGLQRRFFAFSTDNLMCVQS